MNNSNDDVTIDPEDSDLVSDLSGHGTGESAEKDDEDGVVDANTDGSTVGQAGHPGVDEGTA